MVSVILCVFGGLCISYIHLWSIGLWVTRSATNILSWCTRGLGDSFQSRYIFGLDTYGGPIYLQIPLCFVVNYCLAFGRPVIFTIWINFGWFFCRQPRCFGLPAARVNSLKSRLAEKMGVSHLDLPGKSLVFFAEMHWRCYFWRSDGGCRPSEQIWWTRPLQLGNMQKMGINEVEFRHVVNMTHGSVDTTKCL